MHKRNSVFNAFRYSPCLDLVKCLAFVTIILTTFSCKEAFTPKELVSDNSRYLVIEGTIDSGNDSTFIYLSRTKKVDTSSTILPESNAQVVVESDANNSYSLVEIKAGTYAAAPLNLDGSHKYRLRIKTNDSKEYVSDYVVVKNAPPIDNVNFSANSDGVHITVDAHDNTGNTRYYRWEYVEDWQFHAYYRAGFKSNNVDSIVSRPASEDVYNCFGHSASQNVIIASTTKLSQDIVSLAPITVIPSSSEKIETKYSILVKQYALNSDAYGFWENLQKNTEKQGSIFDVLPSETESNFHCVSNPNELVVGYLSVGSSTSKRIFIDASQLPSNYAPSYPEVCKIDSALASPTHPGQLPLGDLIPPSSPYVPLVALYLQVGPPDPDGYTYSTKVCGDCTLRGSKKAPAFWK
jgi:hypothetical protein